MAKGHRSQIKRERNEQKDTRPSAKISTLESLFRKHATFWMPSEVRMYRQHLVF